MPTTTITVTGLLGKPNIISRRTAMAEAIVYCTDKKTAKCVRGFALGLLPQHLPVTITGELAGEGDAILVKELSLARPIDKDKYFKYIDELRQFSLELDARTEGDPMPKMPDSYAVLTKEYDFWMRKMAGSKKAAQPLWEDIHCFLLDPAIENWGLCGKPIRQIPEDVMSKALYPYPVPYYIEHWRHRLPAADDEKMAAAQAAAAAAGMELDEQITEEAQERQACREHMRRCHSLISEACSSFWRYRILVQVFSGIIDVSQASLEYLMGIADEDLIAMSKAEELYQAGSYQADPDAEELLLSQRQARIGQALMLAGLSTEDICKLEAAHRVPPCTISLPIYISYMRLAAASGSTVRPTQEIIDYAHKLIPEDYRGKVHLAFGVACKARANASYDCLLRYGTAGTAHGTLLPDGSRFAEYGHIGLVGPVRAERIIADIVSRRRFSRKADPCYAPAAISQAAAECSPDQVSALQTLLATTGDVKILTGGPGTGKTTTLRRYLDLYQQAHPGAQVALCAPTGRAAQRMSEQTGRPASTIHKLLEITPYAAEDMRPRYTAQAPIPVDLLVCDESSMLTAELAAMLLSAVPMTSSILLIGDPDQLPAIGAGSVLKDLLAVPDECLPKARLTTQHRSGDAIGITAKAVLAGRPLEGIYNSGQVRVFQARKGQTLQMALAVSAGQVLAPKYAGEAGIDRLNEELRKMRNPGPTIRFGRYSYTAGDPVIFTRNVYDSGYMNGDIGTIVSVTSAEMAVDLFGQQVIIGKSESEDVRPAYCISVHKFQGSEADYVTIVLPADAGWMVHQNLLYTAMTRAKKAVIIVCELTDDGRGDTYLAAACRAAKPRITLLPTLLSERLGCRIAGDDVLGEDKAFSEHLHELAEKAG